MDNGPQSEPSMDNGPQSEPSMDNGPQSEPSMDNGPQLTSYIFCNRVITDCFTALNIKIMIK